MPQSMLDTKKFKPATLTNVLPCSTFKKISWSKFYDAVDELEKNGCDDAHQIVTEQMVQNPTPFIIPHDTRLSKRMQNALRCLQKLLDTLDFPKALRHDYRWLFMWLHKKNAEHSNFKKTMLILLFIIKPWDNLDIDQIIEETRQNDARLLRELLNR